MKSRSLILVSALSAMVLAGLPAFAQETAKPLPGAPAAAAKTPQPNDVILSYGNKKVTYADFMAYISVLPAEIRTLATTSAKRQVAEQMIIQKLLADEARTKGLDKTPGYTQQLAIMQDNILVGLLAASMDQTLISNDEIKKYYDEHKTDFDRFTLRQIVIPIGGKAALTDAQAKAKADALKKRLDAGEDFAAIAKSDSADTGTAENGGLIPTALSRDMVPDEVEKIAIGKISDPIQLKDCYCIFKVEKRETATFDECKETISNALHAQKFDNLTDSMIKTANPKYDDDFFGPAETPAAPESVPTK